MSIILRCVPHWLKARLRREMQDACRHVVSPRFILESLAVPLPKKPRKWGYFVDTTAGGGLGEEKGLPIPPAHLTMSYLDNVAEYLANGRHAAAMVRDVLIEQEVPLGEGAAAMDWGCTSGRVLRWFAEEAQTTEFWGVDIDGPSIAWAKANLSPPFNFLQSTVFPHLPFPDGTFSLIYGVSVMTHIEHFRDLWLMEIKRTLKPGGLVILTIHDEHTLAFFQNRPRLEWLPSELTPELLVANQAAVIEGERWNHTFTFFSNDHIRHEWGQYLDVVKIQPFAEGYQSAVIMRK